MIHALANAAVFVALLLSPGLASPIGQAAAPTQPPTVLIAGVPRHAQLFNLSCESRSAADLAAYWGAAIGEVRILASLPASDNPHKGFVGDVNQPPGSMPPAGYGVYAEPIATALRRFGVNATSRSELGIAGLQAELAAGRPAVIWATYGMQERPTLDWTSADGLISRLVRYEHTFVAIGYDAEGFYLVDAYDGTVQHYGYAVFDAAWRQLGRMAVTAEGLMPAWEHAWLAAGPPCRSRSGPDFDRAACRPR